MRIGYLECFSGISGDMLLGALVDAGVPFALLEETTAALNVGARLEMRKVSRGGLAGTKVDVVTQGLEIREQGTEKTHVHEHKHEQDPHEQHSHDGHTHDAHEHREHSHESHAAEEHGHAEHSHSHEHHRSL